MPTDDRGGARPGSPTVVRTAVAGLVAGVLGLAGWSALVGSAVGPSLPALGVLVPVLVTGVGPALVSLSVVALLRDLAVLGTRASVAAAVCSTLAWGVAALTAVSWSVGFDRADAGLPPSALGAAFPGLFLSAATIGSIAAALVWDAVLLRLRVHDPWLRRPLAVLCAVPTALAAGLSAVVPVGCSVGAVAVLVAVRLRAGRRTVPPAAAAGRSAVLPTVPSRARPLPAALRRRVARLGAVGATLGLPCTALALLGAPVPASVPGLGALPAMNAGLAAGAVAAIPPVLGLGMLAAHRWGRWAAPATAALVAALVLACAGQLQGPGGSAGPLLAAAALAGTAVVLPLVPHLPGGRTGRWGLAALVAAVVGWTGGLPFVATFPLVSPFVAAALALRTGPGRRTGGAGPALPSGAAAVPDR